MINLKDLYKIQSEYSVADGRFKDSEVSYEDYVARCRTFVNKNLPNEYNTGNWDNQKKQNFLLTLTSMFVEEHRVNVEGYISNEGILDTDLLIADLSEAVTGEPVIKDALDDEEIDEIQINDEKTIFVVRNGVTEYYTDKMGRVKQFIDNEEIHILINKLIDDNSGNIPNFTSGNPLLNAKTAKHQYRLNAVHHAANTTGKAPHDFPITNVVIRKFKKVSLELEDLINGKMLTPKMGRLLKLLGRAQMKTFFVGPTGSGKTTLLRIVASTIPKEKRMILIQNPTEITFFDRDAYGRNTRNVVHWEVMPNADDLSQDSATLPNLTGNSLRATPEIIILGEARFPREFNEMVRAMLTGHILLGTFHAHGAEDGVERVSDEIDGDYQTALRKVCKAIDVIVAPHKFENGERKILEISEVIGVDSNGDPVINTLFEFDMTGEESFKNGKPVVDGEFKQVGFLSKKTQKNLLKSMIPRKEFEEFCDPNEK